MLNVGTSDLTLGQSIRERTNDIGSLGQIRNKRVDRHASRFLVEFESKNLEIILTTEYQFVNSIDRNQGLTRALGNERKLRSRVML
jgi:hypothetical protein